MLIVPVPQGFIHNPLLINVATWGALTVELAIGVLVWNRRLRPWLLLAGVLMHGSIMVMMAVGFFTPAMLVLYLAFVSPERVRAMPQFVRWRRRFDSVPRPAATSIDAVPNSSAPVCDTPVAMPSA
jgi:hypothetical protein